MGHHDHSFQTSNLAVGAGVGKVVGGVVAKVAVIDITSVCQAASEKSPLRRAPVRVCPRQ